MFADDGEYYEAVINSICNDEQEVEVTFIGYVEGIYMYQQYMQC